MTRKEWSKTFNDLVSKTFEYTKKAIELNDTDMQEAKRLLNEADKINKELARMNRERKKAFEQDLIKAKSKQH